MASNFGLKCILIITVISMLLITIPFYNNKDYEVPDVDGYVPFDDISEIPKQYKYKQQKNLKCPHYEIGLFITSDVEDIEKRMLMREMLFGITDNLVPCMNLDTTRIFYKFLVKKKNNIPDDILRTFKSEQMEYDDVFEIRPKGDDDWQQSLLKYSQLLKSACITYDHLVISDVFTMIDLEKLSSIISSSRVSNQTISDTSKLVWGSFGSNVTDTMAVILGSSAIDTILDNSNYKVKDFENIISRFYHYHYNHPNEQIPNDLILIDDPRSIIEWPNSIKSIPCVDCVIAIGHIYQDWEMRKIKYELDISSTLPCLVRQDLEMFSNNTSELRPRIAVVTSSFLYDDNCMVEAAPVSALNKREYAKKYGYAFVARSTEYAQQKYRDRNPVWGKVDAIEKVLSYYEWLIWLDMDAIFVNKDLSVEKLLESCEKRVGGKKKFNKINLIIARPIGDDMINAGVFLMRNTDWARDFIRAGIQARRDRAYKGMKEQQAMRDAIKRPNWKPNVLYLNGDDHTINTFPDRYIRGDYIVHYAPEEGCPASPVLGGITKVKVLEESPDNEIALPF